MEHKKNKVIVIGAFGFIGYHLCKALLEHKYNVIAFGHKSARTERYFAQLLKAYPKSLELKEGELNSPDLHVLMHQDKDIGGVFHLAALSVTTGTLDELEQGSIIEVNGGMDSEAFAFAEDIVRHRAFDGDTRKVKLIYLSSAEVYGHSFIDPEPLRESDICGIDPTDERHAYPASKIAGEMMLRFGGFTFDWNIIRLQNPYGPLMNERTLIPKLLKDCAEALHVGPGTYHLVSGNDSRPYVHVDDVVRGLIVAYQHGRNHETYNLAGTSVALADLVRSVATSITNDRLAVMVNRGTQGTHRHIDCSKIKADLLWEPQVHLLAGIREMYDFNLKHASVERAMKNIGL